MHKVLWATLTLPLIGYTVDSKSYLVQRLDPELVFVGAALVLGLGLPHAGGMVQIF